MDLEKVRQTLKARRKRKLPSSGTGKGVVGSADRKTKSVRPGRSTKKGTVKLTPLNHISLSSLRKESKVFLHLPNVASGLKLSRREKWRRRHRSKLGLLGSYPIEDVAEQLTLLDLKRLNSNSDGDMADDDDGWIRYYLYATEADSEIGFNVNNLNVAVLRAKYLIKVAKECLALGNTFTVKTVLRHLSPIVKEILVEFSSKVPSSLRRLKGKVEGTHCPLEDVLKQGENLDDILAYMNDKIFKAVKTCVEHKGTAVLAEIEQLFREKTKESVVETFEASGFI